MKKIQRTFFPGSSWFYIKIYGGYRSIDKIVTHILPKIIKELEKKEQIEKWFFIRYNDPDFHLRVRILTNLSFTEILNTFNKYLNTSIKNGEIYNIQLDTYNRELERYGNSLIEVAESIFYIDSLYCIQILKKIEKENNHNYRWLISLKLIDSFLTTLNLNLQDKKKLIEMCDNSFKTEFGFNKYNSKQFNQMFREQKDHIEFLLNDLTQDSCLLSLCNLVDKKSADISFLLSKGPSNLLRRLQHNNLISSYLHMMLNRLFRSNARIYEVVIYDFMRRFYASKLAREK